MQKNNKVSAAPAIWISEFTIPLTYSSYFIESLEEISNGIKCYEPFEDSLDWIIRIYFNEAPNQANIATRVKLLSEAIGLQPPKVEFSQIENKNWVEELAKQFKAIEAGKFYIYSQFSEPSPNLINIRINPGMAFGTGQHETTYLCLEAITYLKEQGFVPDTVLDLGCGSGVLAIAASKSWNDANITATDNDPIATKIADENATENNVVMAAFTSEGFADIKPQKFDLILANILMNPLLQLAEDMNEYSYKKIVLSGFKSDQTERIMEKYTSLGFKSERLFVRNHWVSLLLSR